jgi:hypothetical protein
VTARHVAHVEGMRNIHNILFRKQEGARRVKCSRVRREIILQEVLGRANRLLSFDTTRSADKMKIEWRGNHRQQTDLISIFNNNNNGESRFEWILGDT